MRGYKLLLWDIRLQIKYGFYFLYAFLTALYVFIILSLPENWKNNVTTLFIFSDPAAMGLFFMGAIVLLEKSQKLPYSFAISPITATEYVCSKILSLGFISLIVALFLAILSNHHNIFIVLLGTALGSFIFTLIGIIVSTKIKSLNQFILWTVPIEILCFIPPILHLFEISPKWLKYYPPNACMEMVSGKSTNFISFLVVLILIIFLFIIAIKSVKKMWNTAGGSKI